MVFDFRKWSASSISGVRILYSNVMRPYPGGEARRRAPPVGGMGVIKDAGCYRR